MGILHALQQDYMAKHPHPRTRPGESWDQLCALGMYQSNLDIWGWKVAPKTVGPNATTIGNNSGPLNSNWRAAPRGAFHFWTNHVGMDMSGGGTDIAMYGTTNLGTAIVPFAGFQSVPGYTRMTYRGWSNNYGGGIPNMPAEPVPPVTVPEADQRKVGPKYGAKRRLHPNIDNVNNASIDPPFAVNQITDPIGWVNGDEGPQPAEGGPWFKYADGMHSHSVGFTDQGTHDLEDLNPKPPIVEPPVEPPVVGDVPTAEENAAATLAAFKPWMDSVDAKLKTLIDRKPPVYEPKQEE